MSHSQKLKILLLLFSSVFVISCVSDSEKSKFEVENFIKAINKYDVSVIENYVGAEKMPLFRQLYSYTDERRFVMDSIFVQGNTAYAIDSNSDTLKIDFERNEDNLKILVDRESILPYFGDKISRNEYFPIVSYYLNLDDTANSNYFYQLQIEKSSKRKQAYKHENSRSVESAYFFEIEAILGSSYACYILNHNYPEIYTDGRGLFHQELLPSNYSHDECVECFDNRYNIEHCKQTCLEHPSSRGFNRIAKFYEEHLIEDSVVFWKAKADKLKLEEVEEKVDKSAYCVDNFPKFHLINQLK
jgi:hypothetical protein